jgi:16S rRNA (adenine1518-N6/adenine1519-N6)-dimethyltransferase
MIESSILQSMIAHASLDQDDVVLDVGAGLGFLTEFLAAKCRRVLAVESDMKLVKVLCERSRNLSNIEIIHGNSLHVSIPRFNKVVSIPPYYISSHLLLWLFDQEFDRAVLIFQKEFVNRLAASVGNECYGWLTVVAYYYVEIDILDDVSKRMFYPQPEVDSVIVRLRPKKPPPFAVKDEKLFKQFVKSLFSLRNRKVRNAIVPFIRTRPVSGMKNISEIAGASAFLGRRVRELAPEDFGALFNGIIE